MRLPRLNLRHILFLTAIATVVAWQSSLVHRRKAMMGIGHAFVIARQAPSGAAPPSLNPLRELFGDEPIQFIYVAPEGERDIQRLRQLFPEAEIKLANPPGDW